MRVKTSLSERISDAIYEQIVTLKKYAPGDKLPNENDLSSEFGVSRATLREAIRALVTQGVLEVSHGRGTFVSKEVKHYRDIQFGDLGKLRMKLMDLFELRRVVETEAVAMACERAGDEEIETILALGQQVVECINERAGRTPADEQFHQAIAAASHNEFMVHLVPMIYRAVSDTLVRMGTDELFAKSTLQDHALIMEALSCRDAAMARNAMAIHMSHAIKSLKAGDDSDKMV
ncbi:MAG: Transcriptional regulator, GntRNA family [Oscillospiraceae bacterium]|nr:Transcriptional regulator, GntRNA family [Oscillospiraceae bacterium]